MVNVHVEEFFDPAEQTTYWVVFRDLSVGEEYLHKDGTWHNSTKDDAGRENFPGLFKSEGEAREVLRRTTS